MQPQRRQSGALWGLAGGALLILMYVLYRFVLRAVNRRIGTRPRATTVITGMQFVFFCVVVIVIALVGFIAARRARRLEAGISAGAVAGLLIALVELGVAVIDAYHARRQGQPSLGSPLLTAFRDFIALALVGVGAGALGGIAGRGGAPEPPVSAAAPFAPSMPATGSVYVPPAPGVHPGDFPSSPPPPAPSSPDDFTTLPSLH